MGRRRPQRSGCRSDELTAGAGGLPSSLSSCRLGRKRERPPPQSSTGWPDGRERDCRPQLAEQGRSPAAHSRPPLPDGADRPDREGAVRLHGRVSTEDQQDPDSSKGWQLSRSRALIEPGGGVVVAEYFDIGRSRSLPWKRRPEAAALLDALARPDRGFEAVVIEEPARAFYGNQFGLTFPVFAHYGVELWVPELGGAIDPGSDAHDLVMSLYGGMSKGERNRIKIRARSAMAAQARSEGRFLGGRPPYGYRLADAGPHPNPAKASHGQRLHRLEPDPATVPIVKRIFEECVSRRGLYAIAEQLTREGIPSPSAHDPERNRHRHGKAWSKMAVRAILANPRYTGRQVWNRQRRDEVLVDVDDVALGHETKMRWNDEGEWIYSDALTHEPLVTNELFGRARTIAAAGRGRHVERKRCPSPRPFALRGLISCAICGRLMQGSYNHGLAHYRCRCPSEYAVVNEVDHPRNLYLREDAVVGPLDGWLAQVFDPVNIDETLDALHAATETGDDAESAKADAARRRLAHCDRRLRPVPRRPRCRHRSGGRERLDRRGPIRAPRRRGRAWPGGRTAGPPHVSRPAGRTGERPRQPARRARHRRAGGQSRGLPSPRAPAHLRPGPPGGDRRVASRARRRPRAIRWSEAGRRIRPGRASRRARGRKSVSEGGLEPPRPCGHQPLKLARLPIPPLRRSARC